MDCLDIVLLCKRSLATLAALIFLLSPNALLFASHATEEMQLAICSGGHDPIASPLNAHSADHHHTHCEPDGQNGETPERGCCSSHIPHSHDLVPAPVPSLICSVSVPAVTFFEPMVYIPEVFLDRFVPPQNLV